jgi:hypothetical protein
VIRQLVNLKGVLSAGLIAMACSSCTVRLDIDSAVAEPLTPTEVHHLNEIGERATGPGSWFAVDVTVPRRAIERIARWELYTHIRIDDCRTGKNVSIVSPASVEQTDGSFERVRELLKSAPDRTLFGLGGSAFIREGQSLRDRMCPLGRRKLCTSKDRQRKDAHSVRDQPALMSAFHPFATLPAPLVHG